MGRVSHEKDGENGVIVGHLNIWAGISLFRQIIFKLVLKIYFFHFFFS